MVECVAAWGEGEGAGEEEMLQQSCNRAATELQQSCSRAGAGEEEMLLSEGTEGGGGCHALERGGGGVSGMAGVTEKAELDCGGGRGGASRLLRKGEGIGDEAQEQEMNVEQVYVLTYADKC